MIFFFEIFKEFYWNNDIQDGNVIADILQLCKKRVKRFLFKSVERKVEGPVEFLKEEMGDFSMKG